MMKKASLKAETHAVNKYNGRPAGKTGILAKSNGKQDAVAQIVNSTIINMT